MSANRKSFSATLVVGLSGWGMIGQAQAADVSVGDAYVRRSGGGQRWTIGTKTVRMVLDGSRDAVRLTSFQNLLTDPPLEYVDPQDTALPMGLASPRLAERFAVEVVWAGPIPEAVDDARSRFPVTSSGPGSPVQSA